MLMDRDADPSAHLHGDLNPAAWGLIKLSEIADRGSTDNGSGKLGCVFLACFKC